MRKGDAGPAVQDGFAHGGEGARVIHIRAEIRAVIDAAQDPVRVRHLVISCAAAFAISTHIEPNIAEVVVRNSQINYRQEVRLSLSVLRKFRGPLGPNKQTEQFKTLVATIPDGQTKMQWRSRDCLTVKTKCFEGI